MDELVIRRARASDLDAVDRLNRQLQDFERSLRRSRRSSRSLPRTHAEALIRRNRGKTGRLLVALKGGRVIAFAACVLDTDVFESRPLSVTVTDLIVAKRWRSQGVAAALLVAVDAYARERKAHSISITTLAENGDARKAYRSLGFREAAVIYEKPVTGPNLKPPAKVIIMT